MAETRPDGAVDRSDVFLDTFLMPRSFPKHSNCPTRLHKSLRYLCSGVIF